MNITIIYATYSGSTALASEVAASTLRAAGHTVALVTAAEATRDTLLHPDLLIIASPSWDYGGEQGRPHEDFAALRQRLDGLTLGGKPVAVIALGDSSFTYFCGAAAHLSEWLSQLGGKEVIPALTIDQYYANEAAAQAQVMHWCKTLLAVET